MWPPKKSNLEFWRAFLAAEILEKKSREIVKDETCCLTEQFQSRLMSKINWTPWKLMSSTPNSKSNSDFVRWILKVYKKKTSRAIYRKMKKKKIDYAWHRLTVCVVQSFCFSTMFGIVVDEHVVGHSQKISLHTRCIWGYDHLKNQILNYSAIFLELYRGKVKPP